MEWTVFLLEQHIEAYRLKTKQIIDDHGEGLKELHWEIRDIPYRVFNQFVESFKSNNSNAKERPVNECFGNVLFFTPFYAHEPGNCQITLFTVPLKIKKVFEVEEELVETV